uniref:hypothetical protein n=1 Tax=Bartonella sp. CL1QHWL TaxID=3243517 RepID=UPI0035D106E8
YKKYLLKLFDIEILLEHGNGETGEQMNEDTSTGNGNGGTGNGTVERELKCESGVSFDTLFKFGRVRSSKFGHILSIFFRSNARVLS